jgi:MSHA biogenesis protein MshM
MYEQHFHLREAPFGLTPDTSYFYGYAAHQEALNVLLVALRMGEGFIKVTGEIGTGKTLICRKLLNLLHGEFVTAYIPNPFMEPTALRYALAEELSLEVSGNIGQHRLLKMISDRLIELRAAGERVVLILDEAQAMPEKSLEALRLLTNLETEKNKLMQVVLFGQPELDEHLRQPHVRQLRQRISFSCKLNPMNRAGVDGYLEHRLEIGGHIGESLFTSGAKKLLYRASRGVPRLVNILAHKSMLAAYGEGEQQILPSHVRSAIRDTDDVHNSAVLPGSQLLGLNGYR